ncbi:LysR family transcriptional regulator [Chitinasiproducens palmae]|uniref:DNA-binding transcriptional regulator, LysR family n=1 Tax=Chitinasiproducens palmae TaxID=1770053 RepID=A0A1H2PLL3_9BURK|nr:LysR family transcriptional regulator [Chitinasiproducens palmae]SDV47378.1 DNA-binding transcriptional regulator, LysR family [Chitinasiproducens palmae]
MLHALALRYFIEVARTGSLAAASEALHVAVSAISRQIAKLEREVGTPLFDRMPRGMVLTESGEALARYARRTLLEGDAVLDDIAAAHALGGRIVRIGCTEGFTRTFMPSVLAEHHAAEPHARFMLRSGTPAQVEQWIATGEVDIGLAFGTIHSEAVGVYFSIAAPVCALMPPSHPLSARSSLSLDDLLAHPLVLLDRGTTVRQLLDWCCAARGVQFEPVLTSNDSSVLHHFAALTGAITLGSRLALVDVAGPSSLVARAIDEPLLANRRLQVMVMENRRLPSGVERFLARLVATLRNDTGKTHDRQ